MTFIQFQGWCIVITGVFLLLVSLSLRATIKSNNSLRDRLQASMRREAAQARIVDEIEELQARVPSVEPAWGSDPSGEPSRKSVAQADEEAVLAALKAERDAIEASMSMPGPFFEWGPAKFLSTDDNDFYDYTPARKARKEQIGVSARTFPDAERKAHAYLSEKFGRKWLTHTLRCIDVKDDDIFYTMGSNYTTTLRVYVFSAMVVD